MRALFGPVNLRHEILGHCKVCLERDLDGETQLLSTPTDLGYPFSSICIKCALIANDRRLRVGQQVQLGNHASAWICRWCGWPIHEEFNSCSKPHFHHSCEWAFRAAMRRFVLLGWIQLALGIVAAALSWRYFRHAVLVFAPTVVGSALVSESSSLTANPDVLPPPLALPRLFDQPTPSEVQLLYCPVP
jgi:hypothetical protein